LIEFESVIVVELNWIGADWCSYARHHVTRSTHEL